MQLLTESVLKAAMNLLQIAHTASASSSSSLGLSTPVVTTSLGSGITTACAGALLNVERTLSTTTANGMRLVMSHTE